MSEENCPEFFLRLSTEFLACALAAQYGVNLQDTKELMAKGELYSVNKTAAVELIPLET